MTEKKKKIDGFKIELDKQMTKKKTSKTLTV